MLSVLVFIGKDTGVKVGISIKLPRPQPSVNSPPKDLVLYFFP